MLRRWNSLDQEMVDARSVNCHHGDMLNNNNNNNNNIRRRRLSAELTSQLQVIQ